MNKANVVILWSVIALSMLGEVHRAVGATVEEATASLDRVEMKNGDSYLGVVEEQKFGEWVTLRRRDGSVTRIPFNEVSQIQKVKAGTTAVSVPIAEPVLESASKNVTAKNEADAPAGTPADVTRYLWFIRLGGSFSGATDYATHIDSGGGTATSKDKAKGSIEYEVGVTRVTAGKAILFDFSIGKHNYDYEDGTAPDAHYYAFLAPKVMLGGGPIRGWFAVGLGMCYSSLGESSYSSGGVSLKADSTTFSFAYAPRLGAEIELNDGLILTPYLSYFSTSPSIKGQATASGTSTGFTIDANRSWFTAGVGITHEFRW